MAKFDNDSGMCHILMWEVWKQKLELSAVQSWDRSRIVEKSAIMKKLFSKIEQPQSSGYAGKVVAIGRQMVTIDELIAEGESQSISKI